MKTNYRALKLVEMGLSAKVVSKLSESQLNTLYSKLLSEAQTVTTTQTTFTKDEVQNLQRQGGSLPGGKSIKPNPDGSLTITKEGELSEEDSPLEKDAEQSYTGQLGPHDASDEAPDGMDDDTGNNRKMVGMAESRKKRKGTEDNPWAICTSQLGKEFGTRERSEWSKKQSNKYERCVKDVKKSLKEGKEPLSLFIENEIMNIVEKHLAPRITKGDLIKYLREASSPTVAPPKRDTPTKPVTPTKPSSPEKPISPYRRRRPGVKPAPAKAISPEQAKEIVIDKIMDILS